MTRPDPYKHRVDRYDEWFERNRHAYRSELQAMRALLSPEGDGLEVGVGTGRFAVPLGVALGLDPSRAMMAEARRRRITVVEGIAESLPFKDARFDQVLMVTVVFLLENPDAAFREARRVLKPGGALVVGFIDKKSDLGAVYERRGDESTFYGEARLLSPEDMSTLLKGTGFRDLAFVQTLFRLPEDLDAEDPVEAGYGRGSFVVVRGQR